MSIHNLPFDTTGLSAADIDEISRKHNKLAVEIESSVEKTEKAIIKSRLEVGSARSFVSKGQGARNARVRMVMRQSQVWGKGLSNERRIDECVGNGTNQLTDMEMSFRQAQAKIAQDHRNELEKAKRIAAEWRRLTK